VRGRRRALSAVGGAGTGAVRGRVASSMTSAARGRGRGR
jgi:hypothetical protein